MKSFSVLFFYLLILFLPTQLGRHFFFDFSFVSGISVDYLAPTIYLTDLFVLTLFVFWLIDTIRIKKHDSRIKRERPIIHDSRFIILSALLLFLIFGILLSKNQAVGLYGFLKLLEFVFLGFYTANNIKKLKFAIVLVLFSVGIIFESLLSIMQYLNQTSIGGFFYFFGERAFNGQTLGIANASINGQLILRSYGTFSHPNVLAGYLVIAMTMVVSNLKSQISNLHLKISNVKKIIYFISVIVGTIALFLTMSRVAILIWTFIILIFGLIKMKKYLPSKFTIYYLLFTILIIGSIFVLSPLRFRFADIKLTDESIAVRGELIKSSFMMFKNNLFFGVGLNNFLVELPQFQQIKNYFTDLQPAHNIFLLVAAQTGITGLIFFLWFIFKTYQRIVNYELRIKGRKPIIHNSLFLILTSVLILGSFDHYFLTLQQGQLLFSFIFGLCWVGKAR